MSLKFPKFSTSSAFFINHMIVLHLVVLKNLEGYIWEVTWPFWNVLSGEKQSQVNNKYESRCLIYPARSLTVLKWF